MRITFRVSSYLDVILCMKYIFYLFFAKFVSLTFIPTDIKLLQMVAPILTCAVHQQEVLSIRLRVSLTKIHLKKGGQTPRLSLHLTLTLEVDVSLGLLRPVCWGLFLAGSSKNQYII